MHELQAPYPFRKFIWYQKVRDPNAKRFFHLNSFSNLPDTKENKIHVIALSSRCLHGKLDMARFRSQKLCVGVLNSSIPLSWTNNFRTSHAFTYLTSPEKWDAYEFNINNIIATKRRNTRDKDIKVQICFVACVGSRVVFHRLTLHFDAKRVYTEADKTLSLLSFFFKCQICFKWNHL